MQRISHDLGTAHQLCKRTTFRERHFVAHRKLFFKRTIRRHSVVIAPLQIADLRMKCAAHSHIYFLKPTTNPQDRQTCFNTGPDKRQSNPVTTSVKSAMGRCFRLAIFFGVHIGPATGEHKAITGRHQVIDSDVIRVRRHNQGQATGYTGNSFAIHRARRMGRILIIYQIRVTDNPNYWTLHRIPLVDACVYCSDKTAKRKRMRMGAQAPLPARSFHFYIIWGLGPLNVP